MSFMKRMADILSAKGNRALDAAEDPSEMFDLAYDKMRAMQTNLNRAIADVMTARKLIENQLDGVQQAIAKLNGQARQAVQLGKDNLAEMALQQRNGLQAQLADLTTQHQQMVEKEANLQGSALRLSAKLAAFKTKKETLRATTAAAQSQVQVTTSLAGLSEEMSDVNAAMDRARARVARTNARAAALSDMIGDSMHFDVSGPTDPIQIELDRSSASTSAQIELAQLKAEMGLAAPTQPIPLTSEPVPLSTRKGDAS